MKRIVVLKGGDSPEREVSLVSGTEIAKELRTMGYHVLEADPSEYSNKEDLINFLRENNADIVFIGLHGGSGEDGRIQAILSLANIPFTGSGYASCALTMDKYLSKLIAIDEGIPCPPGLLLREDLLADYQDPADYEAIGHKYGLPLVVKPNDAGSSVGIHIVHDLNELKPAVNDAFLYSKAVLIERFIPGRELTVTVIDGNAFPIVEIIPKSGFYDYKNKYQKGNTEYIAPAQLSDQEAMLLHIYAQRIYKACRCEGLARIDFRYDKEQFYFLEVNTLPGMTPLSLSPMAAKANGLSFAELLQKIIYSGLNSNR